MDPAVTVASHQFRHQNPNMNLMMQTSMSMTVNSIITNFTV